MTYCLSIKSITKNTWLIKLIKCANDFLTCRHGEKRHENQRANSPFSKTTLHMISSLSWNGGGNMAVADVLSLLDESIKLVDKYFPTGCHDTKWEKEMPRTRRTFYLWSATRWSSFSQNCVEFLAAVIELPIDKGDRHLIFDFSSEFTRGILIPGWLSFRCSVLATAGYDRLFWGAPSL